MAASKAVRAGKDRAPNDPGDALPRTGTANGAHRLKIEGLYRAQAPRLMRMLRRRLSDGEDARDLVHDIFARMAKLGGEKLERLDRPEAYMTRIAGNLLADRAKLERKGRWPLELDEGETPSGIDPVRHLETRDMLARIEAAMKRLKPRTRAIFMAHRIEGMSYGEIAEQFGITVKGVEKQMSRAIAQIDRMLDRS